MANLIPPPLTYPGVYVVEVPQSSRGVSPAPTSITAFLGRAVLGPVNTPTMIQSFGDYQQFFGGNASGYTMPRAVADFFNNGGSQALIIRLVDLYPPPASLDVPADTLVGCSAVLAAASDAVIKGKSNSEVLADATAADNALTGDQKKAGDAVLAAMTPILEDPNGTGPAAVSAGSAAFLNYALSPPVAVSTLGPLETANIVVPATALAATNGNTPQNRSSMLGALANVLAVASPAAGAASQVELSSASTLDQLLAKSKQTPGKLTGASIVLTAMTAEAWASGASAKSVLNAARTAALALTDPEEKAGASEIAFDTGVEAAKTPSAMMDAARAAFNTTLGASLDTSERTYFAVWTATDVVILERLGTLMADGDATAQAAVDAAVKTEGTMANRTSVMLEQVAPSATTPITLSAANVGTWGDGLHATVTYSKDADIPQAVLDTINRSAPPGTKVERKDLFNIIFNIVPPGSTSEAIEAFQNVTLKKGTSATLDTVLVQQSQYVRFVSGPSDTRPAETDRQAFSGGKDSDPLTDADYIGNQKDRTGLYALDNADAWNLLCLPPDTAQGDIGDTVWQAAVGYAATNRAFLIVDPPAAWAALVRTGGIGAVQQKAQDFITKIGGGQNQRYAMLYFPRLLEVNPLTGQQESFVGCGAITGVMARTDVSRGVWKAPAGVDASLNQIAGLEVTLDDPQNGVLNPIAVDCLRTFPLYGSVIWGSRTMRGSNQLSDEYMYIPVRRLANFIEDTLQNSTKWAVFEPNDATLWASLKQQISGFMNGLKNQGAFYSFSVQVDGTTTTAEDIAKGIVNVVIGFAPVQPAEFVVLYFTQIAGQTAA